MIVLGDQEVDLSKIQGDGWCTSHGDVLSHLVRGGDQGCLGSRVGLGSLASTIDMECPNCR